MAEGQKIGGYQCEFVGPVPEELLCKSCKLVPKKLFTTDCCAERFCQACIEQPLNDKKPCPSCGEADFSTFFIKGAQKKILALQVHCAMKQKGCEWVGQLEQLDAHLDTDCQYVDVECPSKCDKKVQKRNLATHLEKDCHKREFMCPYCTYKATFEIVSNVHWPECLLFPLICPNRCGVTCEREFIDDHMQLCSLEEVDCEVSFAGCKEKFLRQDQDKHMKRNVERHLKLTATATLRIKQELQEKDSELKIQEEKLKQNLEEKDQQIRELQESHKQVQQQLQEKDAELKQELQKKDESLKDDMNQELKKRDNELKLKLEEKDQQVRESAAEVTALKKQLQETDQKFSKDMNAFHMAAGVPPYHLTMANYAELKGKSTYWNSERFYTHPGGYQCYIRVWPNGLGEGNGTHVTAWLYSAAGQFDGTLPWPAKVTFTLQLLNQHRDQDHVTVTKRIEWRQPTRAHHVGVFSWTFIPHAELGWNAGKQTEYLHEDCLRFRMAKIQLHN